MTDFGDLSTRIPDFMGARTDITSTQIEAFIQLAEARFNREIIVPEREIRATATVVGATDRVTLPADFWECGLSMCRGNDFHRSTR